LGLLQRKETLGVDDLENLSVRVGNYRGKSFLGKNFSEPIRAEQG
jgi:hypothetical protein